MSMRDIFTVYRRFQIYAATSHMTEKSKRLDFSC